MDHCGHKPGTENHLSEAVCHFSVLLGSLQLVSPTVKLFTVLNSSAQFLAQKTVKNMFSAAVSQSVLQLQAISSMLVKQNQDNQRVPPVVTHRRRCVNT